MPAPPSRMELVRAGVLDPYRRKQAGLSIREVYPDQEDGTCACGCGQELEGRRTRYATDSCARECGRRFRILYGDTRTIRRELYRREGGAPYGRAQASCQLCGEEHGVWGEWDAHHVVPVEQGGGAVPLAGFMLLCTDPCHKRVHRAMGAA